MPRALKLLVLTEDGGGQGWPTVKRIVWHLLREVDPDAPLWRDEGEAHEWIDPRDDRDFKLLGGNLWRSESREHAEPKRQLLRAIATRLLEHDVIEGERRAVGFVFFHHDGDAPWSEHPSCTLCQQFDAFRTRLAAMLQDQVMRDARVPDEQKEDLARAAMSRLFVMEPHWSIEAWLYGRSSRARALCREQHGGSHDTQRAFWSIPRAELEELPKPKDNCCLEGNYNLELAASFKADDAYLESPSFAPLAERVLSSADLKRALAVATAHPGW